MKSMFYPILSVSLHSKLPSKNYFRQRFISTVNNVEHLIQKNEGQLTENVMKEKLSSLNIDFTDGFTCLHLKNCNLCSKKKVKCDLPVLYLNKKTGFFLCNQCKISGSWSTFVGCLEQRQGKTPRNKHIQLPEHLITKYEENLKNWQNIVNNSVSLTDLNDHNYYEIFKKFNLNFCERNHIENLKARISKDCSLLYFPLRCNDSSIVGYKIFSNDGKSITYPNAECSGVMSTCKNVNAAVVVAEVRDFFALVSQNITSEILCLPYGVSVLPQSSLPVFEHFSKIMLWLGGIEALEVTANFANKLNNKRCYIVKPINNQKSAQFAVNKKENIFAILENSKSTWHEYIVSFSSLRDEVLAQLQNKDQCAGVQWQRFPVLNQILKGHRRGELTLLTGPTGSGKTTFISEYSLDLALQGVNTLWGSFEIKNVHLAKKMLQQYARLPLEKHLDKFIHLADKFEKLPIFFMSFHGQHDLFTVMDAVEHCSYVYDIAHVIIDNVQFMIDIQEVNSKFDRFYKQDVLIQKFRKFATEHNCHVTLVMHPRKGFNETDLSINSIFGGVKAVQEADNILIIQNRNFNTFLPRKTLQVEKNRYCGDLGNMILEFDKNTCCFSQNSKKIKEKMKFEVKQNEEFYDTDERICFQNCEDLKPQKFNQQFEFLK